LHGEFYSTYGNIANRKREWKLEPRRAKLIG